MRKTQNKVSGAVKAPVNSSTSKSKADKFFPIVGVGSSAGGLEAVRELLAKLPEDTGMAFILVQHLDPRHESLGPEILARTTKMPVQEAKNQMPVEPNHIYLIPPNHGLEISKEVLVLLPLKSGSRGQHLVIDAFFQSLGKEHKSRSIGVVLSGTASDGTEGLRAIKAEGGLTIAQDPDSAKYRGMPESAIHSGFVDLILNPKDIALELARISDHPYIANIATGPDLFSGSGDLVPTEATEDDGLQNEALLKIFQILKRQSRIDFSTYKESTTLRRIQRRMMVRKSESIEAYGKFLSDNPDEVKLLAADMLIHVTEFFRDPESFKALEELVLPQIAQKSPTDHPLRIWVPGCSTGEEAYSIGILLLEYQQRSGIRFPVQIFATDLSEESLQKARQGIYPQTIESTMSKERLELFFEKVETGYKTTKVLRDLCLFSKHDLTRDPPFSKLDLISCRNMLIYFSNALQKRIIPTFHYALNPSGFLFLGKSESLGSYSKLFSLIDKKHRLYTRENIATPANYRNPVAHDGPATAPVRSGFEKVRSEVAVQRDAEKLALTRYVPPFVLVNSEMEILQFHGRSVPYLEPVSGAPTNSLFKMARRELVQGLHSVTQLAAAENRNARIENLSIVVDGHKREVNIEVIPTKPNSSPDQRHYAIFFEEVSNLPVTKRKEVEDGDAESERQMRQLESELVSSQQFHKTLTEEFETVQEELTSSNEELQSTNEELQSANEELETSKEELQSSNEELTTVNDELQSRNGELIQLSSDLKNLLNNVETAVVIVGPDFRIRRFTPRAEEIFNLIAGDIGRPLSDLNPKFECQLEEMVSKAISTLVPQEADVEVNPNLWMRLQTRPYRTVDSKIDGAVISLIDITAMKKNLDEHQRALRYAAAVSNTLRTPLFVLGENFNLISANSEFYKVFDLDPIKHVGKEILEVLQRRGLRQPDLRDRLNEVFAHESALKESEIEVETPTLGRRIYLLNARPIQWEDSLPRALLLSLDDITDRRMLGRALEQSEDRFRRVVESAHDAILIIDTKGSIEFCNQQALKSFRYPESELIGNSLAVLIPEAKRIAHETLHKEYFNEARARLMDRGMELSARRKDGSEFPVDISLTPIKTGSETRVTVIIHDISEAKKISEERKSMLDQERLARVQSEERKLKAERKNAEKDLFLATLSHELRTPLTSILSWAQLILRNNLDSDRTRHGLQIIEKSAKMQGQLIDDLLDTARIQSGKLSTKFVELDVLEVIQSAIAAVRPLAETNGVKIEEEFAIKSEKIWGDPDRLQQIVWNLLTNAVKFSTSGSTVQVRVESPLIEGKRNVSVQVVDHGKGIEETFLPRLFERFSQADSSSIRNHGGLGLGLALVRDLTLLHGGSVKAESKGLGQGSTFTVLLPVSSDARQMKKGSHIESAGALREIEKPNLNGLKILIVEDDPYTLETLSESLSGFGAETLLASKVSQALEVLRSEVPNVIVSDIAMPDEDGYSFIRKLRNQETPVRMVPALALTAYASEDDLKKVLEAGFDTHMSKPFEVLELGSEIMRLVKSKGASRN